jgi:hypothetical protein
LVGYAFASPTLRLLKCKSDETGIFSVAEIKIDKG